MAQNHEQMRAEKLFAQLLLLWNFDTKINCGRMLVTLNALADMARWDKAKFAQYLIIAEALKLKLEEEIDKEDQEEERYIAYKLLTCFLVGVKAGKQEGNQDKPHSA